ncbi:MAG: potassium channel family protein [Thermomicrobiales bacterium]
MNWSWIIAGIALIAVGLLDLFLSALNYDESGMLTLRLQALQWHVLRGVLLRLPARWRGFGRAQVIGLQILLDLVVWVALVTIGWGFVYFGLMYDHSFQFSGSHIGRSMDYAIYFSIAQFSTVGATSMTPQTTLLRVLGVLETLIGLGIVTLAISFLISVFQTITYLRTLASDLHYPAPGASDPVRLLAVFFPQGQPTGLSDYLGRLHQNLGAYYAGLQLHHTAYYYQSRSDYISLPYVFQALGGVVGALRWGVPEGNTVAHEPLLTVLANELAACLSFLNGQRHWQSEEPPAPQSYQAFAERYDNGSAAGDPWLDRFLALDREMRRLLCAEQPADTHEAYERYAAWLPPAYRVERSAARMAQHLGYDLATTGVQ